MNTSYDILSLLFVASAISGLTWFVKWTTPNFDKYGDKVESKQCHKCNRKTTYSYLCESCFEEQLVARYSFIQDVSDKNEEYFI